MPRTKKTNSVTAPAHYQGPNGVECMDVIDHMKMSFLHGNAFKYLWRAGKKGYGKPLKRIEDLKKARYCIDEEISRCEKALVNRVVPAPKKDETPADA